MRIRGELIAFIAVLAFIGVLALIANREDVDFSQQEPQNVIRSSYRTFPEGYKALYLTLNKLGYHAIRYGRPYDLKLLPAQGTLIVVDPYRVPISQYEGRQLLKWLRQGNHALFLVEYHPETLVGLGDQKIENGKPLKGVTILSKTAHGNIETATPVVPSFLSEAAPTLAIRSSLRFSQSELLPKAVAEKVDGVAPLYHDQRGLSVVSYSTVGQGGIVWCCSPWSFSNAGLAQARNLEFILALANLQPGTPVLFDEYHHGNGTGMSVWTLAPRFTQLGLLQLAAALLLLLLILGWRFGPARLPAEERYTRVRAEYLTSMAGLLARAQATHVVRNRMNAWLRRELGPMLALPPNAALPKYVQANKQFNAVDQAQLERVVNQFLHLEQYERPEAYMLLRLAMDMQRLLARKRV